MDATEKQENLKEMVQILTAYDTIERLISLSDEHFNAIIEMLKLIRSLRAKK